MILFGASGHAKVILEILEQLGHEQFTLWDDAVKPPLWSLPVNLPNESLLQANEEMIISIGINSIRKKVAARYENLVSFATALHPASLLSKRATFGAGTVCMAGVTVNADTHIGKHGILNTNASVDHDCLVSDYVHLSPNSCLCGGVSVGEGTHVGAGATVIPGIKIGRWCTIGAGAVVIREVPDGATVVGNPGKILKVKDINSFL